MNWSSLPKDAFYGIMMGLAAQTISPEHSWIALFGIWAVWILCLIVERIFEETDDE